MKRFSEKNRVCARVTACVFALMLFVLSACENFVVPALQRPVSKSNAHLTELVAQWTDDSSADPSFGPEYNGGSFTATLHKKQNEERFALYGFDEDLHLIRFTLTLSDPSEEITYETFDRVLYEKSARMDVYVNPFSGMGVIELNMLYRFDTDVYIYVGKHVYTICIQKMVRNNRIYVSKYGDGSGSMDDTTGGELRGYTPDTAFFSLKNAIDRGKLTERYDIYIVGELDNDPEMPAGDAIFVIDNTDGHRFRFWDGGGGSLKSPPDSHKRVMNVQNADVAFIDLDISGGNGVNYGGAMFIEASRAAFLRCDIKDNVAADKGGAVYVADKASWRSSSSVTFSSTTVRDNTRPRPEPFGSATEGIWAGIYTKLTFENAAIHDGVYFNGEPEVGTFVVGGSSYFGKGNSITLDEIIAGDYGAQIWLPNEDAKITLAGNVPSGMDTYGLAAFIDTPAPAGRQVLYEASGNAAHLADVYNRFRINNSMPLTGRVASLRGIDDDGIVIESGEAHVRSDGNDFCDGLTEGSAFKSFEYAVFAANRFVAPRAKVVDMLNGANHRELPTAVGWAASDTNSVFSVGIPHNSAEPNPPSIIIEGKDIALSGLSAGGTKRALYLGAYSDITLKDLKFAGSTTMTQNLGSAVSVTSNVKFTVAGSVDGGTLGVLIDGSAVIAGDVTGSGNTEITAAGSLTVKGDGSFSSTGKILLSENKKITIDGILNNWSADANIAPYKWTIGYEVLQGDLAANTGKFTTSLNLEDKRNKWKITDAGKLAHSVNDAITLSDPNGTGKPAISGSFYLGADYVTVNNVTLADNTDSSKRIFIYARSNDGQEKILRDDSFTNPANITFSFVGDAETPGFNTPKGGWYYGVKRAIGALYKWNTTNYALKFVLDTDEPLPVYTRQTTGFPTDAKTWFGSYWTPSFPFNSTSDYSFYFFEISGAKGGDGGDGGYFRGLGSKGALGTFGARVRNGDQITYGAGKQGQKGQKSGDYDGGGGGGGGADSWIEILSENASGAYVPGYYIATGGNGGRGPDGGDGSGTNGGGGGYGGGGNQAGGPGFPGHANGNTSRSGGGGGGGALTHGSDGGNFPHGAGNFGGSGGAALPDNYICAGAGGGSGGACGSSGTAHMVGGSGNGGHAVTRNNNQMSGGGGKMGATVNSGGYGGLAGSNYYTYIYTPVNLIKRFKGNANGNVYTDDGYVRMTGVLTATR